MEIRRTPLPGKVQHAIDGASEGYEIDGCTAAVLMLYGDPARLEPLVQPMQTTDERLRELLISGRLRNLTTFNRQHLTAAFMAEADTIMPSLGEELRGKLISDGIRGMDFAVGSMCEVYADWAWTDETQGGDMEPFREARDIKINYRRGEPFKNTWRMICSPSFIRRYVKRSDELWNLRNMADTLVARARLTPSHLIKRDIDGLCAVFDEQLAAFREHRRIEFEAEERAFYTEVLGPARERDRYRRLPQKLRRKAQEGNKKILKRAVKIASSVLGVHAVSALARGDKINVEGPNMTLQMQKSGFLTDMGMHAIDVAMLDHSGELLAKLCVYQDKVPAIDQAVGFALMVQSGMEKELVDEANIVTLTPAGQSNIIIAERQQRALQGVERMGAPPLNCAQRNRMQFGHDQDRWWHRKYWEETKHIWIDTVTAAVLGPHRKMFNALAAQ